MKGVDCMDYTQEELKDIWSRSDAYYSFSFGEYKNFGNRLKKWRELNDVTKTDMAEAIYSYRKHLGLEDDDISNEEIEIPDDEFLPIDYEVTAKRQQKKERRTLSLMRTYNQWECKETDSFSADTPFSMNNLYILKHLLHCDYEFLFCEIDTPHIHSNDISDLTGLNISTIEKLSSCSKASVAENESSPEYYANCILTALNKLISNDDFMTYLSYYLTNLDYDKEDDNSNNDNYVDSLSSSSSISITRPVAGIPSEDAYLDGTVDILNKDTLDMVFLFTLTNKLSRLRDANNTDSDYSPSPISSNITESCIADVNDSFGDRLRKWRESKQYTQDTVADLIFAYRKEHDIKKVIKGISHETDKDGCLRTYQNWERKKDQTKDTRLSMSDLIMLKNIMDCDYDYLFGEIQTLKVPEYDINRSIGLSSTNIDKLEKYAASMREYIPDVPAYASHILTAIDLILTDNDLLSNLAYYLSDMPYYYQMNLCSTLKPVKIYGLNISYEDDYIRDLFDEKELRNVFLPSICDSLMQLREKNMFNNEPIRDKVQNR